MDIFIIKTAININPCIPYLRQAGVAQETRDALPLDLNARE